MERNCVLSRNILRLAWWRESKPCPYFVGDFVSIPCGHLDTKECKSKILDIAEIELDISCAGYYIYGYLCARPKRDATQVFFFELKQA